MSIPGRAEWSNVSDVSHFLIKDNEERKKAYMGTHIHLYARKGFETYGKQSWETRRN